MPKKQDKKPGLSGVGGKLLRLFDRKKSGGKSGLATKLALLGIFLAIMAIVTWQMARMGKKLATLENAKERKKVEANNLKIAAKAETVLTERKAIEVRAKVLLADAKALDQQLKEAKAEAKRMEDALSRVKTWKDIDALVVYEDE